ncbi:MAG: sensor domain-containing diguanylate cyclase [Desulfobulbaceae bacterium]|nr:sensor domain-containing diguanylate cyclase [Desulfobulbaceae bacterium]
MKYCDKSKEELAEDIARLRQRIMELEAPACSAQPPGRLDKHIDSFRLWNETFNAVDDLMYVVDREFNIVRANKATSDILDSDTLLGKKCFQLFHHSTNPASHCPACKVFHSGKPFQLERQEKSCGDRWYSISAYPIKDDFGFVWQCLVIYRDITDCKQMMFKLNELEIKDHLTELINRRHFLEVVAREFRLAARRGGKLVLLLLAVDKFKEINNSCGRKFGDHILEEISELLVDKVRNTDICARVGADEFAVLLPDADCVEGERIARNIHNKISRFVFDNGSIGRQISMSIGLAANHRYGLKDHEEFFSLADKALHQAKKDGGNRVVVPDDNDDYLDEEIGLISNY